MCTKEQLIEIAEYYHIEMKGNLKQGLVEVGGLVSGQSSPTVLTFEQQRKQLHMQLEISRYANRLVADTRVQFDVAQNLQLLLKFD